MYTLPLSAPAVALSRRAAARARSGLPPRRRGGQPGNRNRLVHGRYSRAWRVRRAQVRTLLRQSRALVAAMRAAASLRRFVTTHQRAEPRRSAEAASRRNFYNTHPSHAGYARAASTRTARHA